ncbi:MAG: biotin--[acetyl-CoA-carboxylase] ligase [Myxococcota bacterium]
MTRLSFALEHHATLPSTNDRALARAREGATEGLVVLADAQTQGRGQRGAHWYSPPDDGLYASILLRPRMPPESFAFMTLAAGVAVVDAIEASLPGAVGLKWPNDVLLAEGPDQGAKVGGILVEGSAGARVEHAVVGVGLNLRGHPGDKERRARALSSAGEAPTREAFLAVLESTLGQYLSVLEGRGTGALLEAWHHRALGLNDEVDLLSEGAVQVGTLLGLDSQGRVRARLDDDIRTFDHVKMRLGLERRWLSFPP